MHELPFSYTIRPFIIIAIFSFLSLLILNFIFRNKSISSIIASVFFLLLFSYGSIRKTLQPIARSVLYSDVNVDNHTKIVHNLISAEINQWFSLSLIWFFFLTICFFVIKKKRSARVIALVARNIGLVLLLVSILNITNHYGKSQILGTQKEQIFSRLETQPLSWNKNEPPPDIYYIILDEHARSDVLKKLYDYDNTEFINQLQALGFYVAEESSSNYSFTAASLASSLNMNYINYLTNLFSPASVNTAPYYKLIQNNAGMRLLKEIDYTMLTFNSGVGLTDLSKQINVYLQPTLNLNPFEKELINMTPLLVISKPLYQKLQYGLHYRQILFTLDELKKIPLMPQPTFTLAHIISPHPPFIFNADGSFVENMGVFSLQPKLPDFSYSEFKEGYHNQIIALDQKIIETITQIIANSASTPIVILQSDTGPYLTMNSWQEPNQESVWERMSILNAYLLPDLPSETLYPDISPVNSFRILFNNYFNTNYSILPDKNYYSSNISPFQFTEYESKFSVEPITDNPSIHTKE